MNHELITAFVMLSLCSTRCFKDTDDYVDTKPVKESPVEVRTVFINCQPDELKTPESESVRFERQERFKHSVLRDCNKKLAITIKISNEIDSPTDEYIPIDHVFEGSNKKRVRLLNPYVLRLRREPPVQAYKLHRIDTVSGVISKSEYLVNTNINKRNRAQRDVARLDEEDDSLQSLAKGPAVFTLEHEESGRNSYSVRVGNLYDLLMNAGNNGGTNQAPKDCGLRLYASPTSTASMESLNTPRTVETSHTSRYDHPTTFVTERRKPRQHSKNSDSAYPQVGVTIIGAMTTGNVNSKIKRQAMAEVCPRANKTILKRAKRYDSTMMDSARHNDTLQIINDHYYPDRNHDTNVRNDLDETSHMLRNANTYEDTMGKDKELVNAADSSQHKLHAYKSHRLDYNKPDLDKSLYVTVKNTEDKEIVPYTDVDINNSKERASRNYQNEDSNEGKSDENTETSERDFALYEIGTPSLWYKVNVQLFEKMSTPEGKTVWNDITKGESASVSATSPQWRSQDLDLQYRPAEWIAREDFTLPATGLCLLVPLQDVDANVLENESEKNKIEGEEYIVVPVEDVVGLDDITAYPMKRDDNYSNTPPTIANGERRRKVEVRITRALFGSKREKFGITTLESEQFLTIPHRRPHRAQIDLEVRADDNELVFVGSSGCIATVVADNTRVKRTIITLQASNKGLASARFRVTARDCGPELSSLINEKNSEGVTAGPVLLPPKHTRRLRLELPIEIPVDLARCNVALINDDDEAVAVREVAIKKGDRCFCVWHCDCVCLTEDPKLLCREMSPTRQAAAGLTSRERPRHARSICYSNSTAVNVLVVVLGVITLLLTLGLFKACFGLRCKCVALAGVHRLLKLPRKIPHYYESRLANRPVEYDAEGWPIDPDTKKRSGVLPVSKLMLFLLNLTFFVTMPFIILRDGILSLFKRRGKSKANDAANKKLSDDAKCFSSQDMQSLELHLRRRKRPGLRCWMTPNAQDLSSAIWEKGLEPQGKSNANIKEMQPLLHEECCLGKKGNQMKSVSDSEQDDTQYVLSQMQKSRESLARSQRKQNDSAISSLKKQCKEDKR